MTEIKLMNILMLLSCLGIVLAMVLVVSAFAALVWLVAAFVGWFNRRLRARMLAKMARDLAMAALFALTALRALSAEAQTNPAPTIPQGLTEAWDLIQPVLQASNHTIFLFGGEDITKKQALGGVGDVFNFNKNFGFFTDFQFESPNTLSGVAGSLMFQVPIYPFGGTNFCVSPNTYAGLMTHIAGYGTQNGTVDAVAGVGGSVHAYKWLYFFGEYEARQNSNTKAVLGGLALKLFAGDGTGIFGHNNDSRYQYAYERGLETFR